MPAGSNMSSASMNAEPTIPKTFLVPWATIVSTNASLDVIFVGTVLQAGAAPSSALDSLKDKNDLQLLP